MDWYSRMGLPPAIVYTEVQPAVARTTGNTDLSSIYNRNRVAGTLTAAVPRSSLWKAALQMFVAHPFGVGPDNFRLLYGRYLGATRWDTRIYSNNLYLELLTGSGFLGLVAFAWVIAVRRWNRSAASLAIAVFLIHGILDVFLMTTPIYFAFWILLPGQNTSVNPDNALA
jgi:O-antigen ligase